MSVREKLQALRGKTGLSQAKFARKFEIPVHTYESWEMEIRKPPEYVIYMIELILTYEEGNDANE